MRRIGGVYLRETFGVHFGAHPEQIYISMHERSTARSLALPHLSEHGPVRERTGVQMAPSER